MTSRRRRMLLPNGENLLRLLNNRTLGTTGPLNADRMSRRLHQAWVPRAHHSVSTASLPSSKAENVVWNPSFTPGHSEAVSRGIFNLEFNESGSVLAAACEHRSVLLMDPGSRKTFHTLTNAHSDCVNCIRFLDDRFFASCSDDCTVALWDLRNLKTKVRTFKGHTNWVKNIEYSPEDQALLSCGFDGAIYRWDVNRYTDPNQPGEKIFHTGGLMRMRLAPPTVPGGDHRLVMSTMHGFLMVVHNFSLDHFKDDMKSFKPNLYRLLQLSRQPVGGSYEHTKCFHSKRNRIEFIDDFPSGNQAELISSLKIHPHGWVAVNRNISSDENSEWCCVHNIHAPAPNPDEDEPLRRQRRRQWEQAPSENGEPAIRRARLESHGFDRLAEFISASFDMPAPRGGRRQISIRVNEDADGRRMVQITAANASQDETSDSESSTSSEEEQEEQPEEGGTHRLSPEEIQIRSAMSRNRLEQRRLEHLRRIRERRRVSPSADRQSIRLRRELGIGGVSVAPGPTRAGDAVAAAGAAEDEEQDVERVSNFIYNEPMGRQQIPRMSMAVPDDAKVHRNTPRLTHYIEESNTGRGFIKEVSFSADGKILCSPFGFGVRLLSFDEDCLDWSQNPPNPGDQPRALHELGMVANCHLSCVLSTAFAPHQYLLVAGSLQGQISWHQPLL